MVGLEGLGDDSSCWLRKKVPTSSLESFDLGRSSSTVGRMQNPFEDLINLYQIKLVDVAFFIFLAVSSFEVRWECGNSWRAWNLVTQQRMHLNQLCRLYMASFAGCN